MRSKKTVSRPSSPIDPALPVPRWDVELAAALLEWFLVQARDLPWRHTLDPYAIWISEIMLQQTQVKTVIPYWQRWMREFPDVATLARAPMEKVLKLWEGLGYYRRARLLHAAALQMHESGSSAEGRGKRLQRDPFPRAFEEVLQLPGIGRYTAGAICSIAYNQPVPILDGNVIRVLSRVHALAGDPRDPKVNTKLWSLAHSLVQAAASLPARHARQFAGNCSALNQALMELGATVCTPRAPNCLLCPLRSQCQALRSGYVEKYPQLAERPAVTARYFQAFVLERSGRIQIRRRAIGEVNEGLWEFPNVEVGQKALKNPDQILEATFEFRTAPLKPLAVVRHSITRYRMLLQAHHAELDPSIPAASAASRSRSPSPSKEEASAAPEARWVTAEEAIELPFTSAHKKLLGIWLSKRGALLEGSLRKKDR